MEDPAEVPRCVVAFRNSRRGVGIAAPVRLTPNHLATRCASPGLTRREAGGLGSGCVAIEAVDPDDTFVDVLVARRDAVAILTRPRRVPHSPVRCQVAIDAVDPIQGHRELTSPFADGVVGRRKGYGTWRGRGVANLHVVGSISAAKLIANRTRIRASVRAADRPPPAIRVAPSPCGSLHVCVLHLAILGSGSAVGPSS